MKFKFAPTQMFADDAKKKFLAAFDAHYASPSGAPWLVLTARMLGAALAIAVIVMSGATVYADAANVPADSPLYPFKRLGENVQLAVTPPQADASLQASFAARRVAEITDLQDRHPTSTMIAELSNDADNAVNASIVASERSNLGDGQLTNLCTRLLSTLLSSSTTLQGEGFRGNLNLLDHFTRRCEEAGTSTSTAEGGGGSAGEQGSAPSSTPQEEPRTVHRPLIPARPAVLPQATTTSSEGATSGFGVETTSEAPTPNVPELETRIRDYLDTHLSASSSLDLVNPSKKAPESAVIELQGVFRGGSGNGSGGGSSAGGVGGGSGQND